MNVVNLILKITGRKPKGANMQLDPNGPIYKAAIALGYNDPEHMSEAQLERAVLAANNALPAPPVSPFTQETDDFKKRAAIDAADRAFAVNLATKVATAMRNAFASFQTANTERFNRIIQNLHANPAQPEPTSASQDYERLKNLNGDLFLYLEAITPGWTGNIGLPGHETQAVLLERLKISWPAADAAVNS
jgi:hypothetical protein